jgi:UDP-N-acetylmuramoyl-L-alanyl-D-glutamate--2,6-diaminopimelate ligase
MMAQMVASGCKACVMEVSSHALDQKRVTGVEFDVAIFTNISNDHLDYHGSVENYVATKERLFTRSANGAKQGAVVINIDDASGARILSGSDVEVKLSYGIKAAASVRATNLQLAAEASHFTIETPKKNFACKLPLIGRHNIYNALAATGAACALNVELTKVQSALNKMHAVPGRLERVNVGQPFNVFVDYAHSADALTNVLATVREITSGRVLLLFGCGGTRDWSKRDEMGRIAAQGADYTFITSDNPRKEQPETIAAQIVQGFRSVKTRDYSVELDRKRAINEILSRAQAGDTVVIAGKGHETYQEFADTIIPFDDRVFAREALQSLGFKGGRR